MAGVDYHREMGSDKLRHAATSWAYRHIRWNPAVELLQTRLRRRGHVNFDELDLFVPATKGDIIIDGGANVGGITSKCVRTGATVHAFEPNPVCYDILRRRFSLLPNVHVHQLGLMDKNCTLTFSTPVAHNGYNAIEATVAGSFVAEAFDADVKQERIECIDVYEFVESLDRPVALFKLDIEGAEVAVINRLVDTGAVERIKMAVVETHERFSPELALQTDELRERLKSKGLADRFRLDWD